MSQFLVQEYLENAVQVYPHKIAVTDGTSSVSYSELHIQSNQLANCLREAGVSKNHKVAICSGRSPATLISIIGVLKTGAIYVPIDPKSPVDRLGKILKDCVPVAVICDTSTISDVKKIADQNRPSILLVSLSKRAEFSEDMPTPEITLDELHRSSCSLPKSVGKSSDTAYILYTSGSTGAPKGVMVTHKNVKHYIDWFTEQLALNANDIILSTAPFHFDMSIFDIFATQKASATMCIAPDNFLLFPEMLVKYIEQQEISVWKGVSSLLMYMCRMGTIREGRMPSLRKVVFAGEHLPSRYLMEWMAVFPEKAFFNAYGPTETTGVSVYHPVQEPPPSITYRVPIGKPRGNTRILVLDEDGQPVQPFEVGELYIGGPGVAVGYLNDPMKTASHFVPDPLDSESSERFYRTGDMVKVLEDGDLEFVGRLDGQIKVMGFRVELGEIEDCLHSVEGVNDACVLLLSDENQNTAEVVAFAEATDDCEEQIFKVIQNQLPQYMMPKHLYLLDCLPRCNRGKVSRDDLENIFRNDKRECV